MSRDAIVIPLQSGPDHHARCRATLAADTGWDVLVEMDERVVSSTHCRDWHHVERICGRIEREWERHHLTESADNSPAPRPKHATP
jgi:hypothetical protein